MADPTSSTAADPSALMQLLALLQQQGSSGAPPSAANLPNQTHNAAGQVFQLGAGGQATPENPGSSPEFSAPGTLTSLPTSGMSDQALQNWYNSNQGNTFYNSQGQLAGIPSGGQEVDQIRVVAMAWRHNPLVELLNQGQFEHG